MFKLIEVAKPRTHKFYHRETCCGSPCWIDINLYFFSIRFWLREKDEWDE